MNIVPLKGTGNIATLRDGSSAATNINARIQDTTQTANPNNGIKLCFASGGTDQSGLMTIGAAGQPGVSLKIFSNGTCT
jgi:hypothetical protein